MLDELLPGAEMMQRIAELTLENQQLKTKF